MEDKKINYCPKCGNKLTGNEKFCSVCGNPVLENFSDEKSNLISESGNKIQDKKKPSIIKRILIGVGIVFIALIVIGIFLPEDENGIDSENVVETEAGAEGETTKSESILNDNLKSDLDVSETLKNLGESGEPSFTVSDAQADFINSHINLFPADSSDFEEVSNYIDDTLDYAHMVKNPENYIGKFAFVDGLRVIQVAEEKFDYGSSQYNYVTGMLLEDDSENIYVVYYVGKSIELVQGDYARIIAMPIAYSSYKNLEDNSVLSLIMVASVAENQETSEITGGYFSDKYQVQAEAAVPTEEYMENAPVSNEVPAGNYGSDPSAYAGRYEGAGYTIEFSVGSDIDTDEVGDVCVYYGGNCESEHIPVYTCTSAGDWSISNYDAVYEIREEGNPMYMMFYEANGTVYMDYSSPNRNAGVLELVQRYIS